jgi:hypothetical protein
LVYLAKKTHKMQLVLDFLVIGAGGMLLYQLIPACGPTCAYGYQWPWQLPAMPLNPALLAAPKLLGDLPRNCMPSLHAAWILCLWRHAWKLNRLIRITISAWAILTLFATLTIGQHYLVDIVAGFAFALMLQSLCACTFKFFMKDRLLPLLTGLALFCCWLIIMAWGLKLLYFSPIIPYTLFTFTLFCTWLFTLKLANAETKL